MKQFILLYDEIVPGYGVCERGTIFDAVHENERYVSAVVGEIEWRFFKTHVVEL